MTRTAILISCLAAAAAVAGPKKASKPSPDAGTPGARVIAPFGKGTSRNAGTVMETYGRYVFVRFDDRNTTWIDVDMVNPPQKEAPRPTDKNKHEIGAKVHARFSSWAKYPGTVIDTYGKLALILFDDNARAWVLDTECIPR